MAVGKLDQSVQYPKFPPQKSGVFPKSFEKSIDQVIKAGIIKPLNELAKKFEQKPIASDQLDAAAQDLKKLKAFFSPRLETAEHPEAIKGLTNILNVLNKKLEFVEQAIEQEKLDNTTVSVPSDSLDTQVQQAQSAQEVLPAFEFI